MCNRSWSGSRKEWRDGNPQESTRRIPHDRPRPGTLGRRSVRHPDRRTARRAAGPDRRRRAGRPAARPPRSCPCGRRREPRPLRRPAPARHPRSPGSPGPAGHVVAGARRIQRDGQPRQGARIAAPALRSAVAGDVRRRARGLQQRATASRTQHGRTARRTRGSTSRPDHGDDARRGCDRLRDGPGDGSCRHGVRTDQLRPRRHIHVGGHRTQRPHGRSRSGPTLPHPDGSRRTQAAHRSARVGPRRAAMAPEARRARPRHGARPHPAPSGGQPARPGVTGRMPGRGGCRLAGEAASGRCRHALRHPREETETDGGRHRGRERPVRCGPHGLRECGHDAHRGVAARGQAAHDRAARHRRAGALHRAESR